MVNFMEKKAQQEMLKRAMEATWIAQCCIGMVYGPLSAALEVGRAEKSAADQLVHDWLRHWRDVRNMSDRNLHRNRDYYRVRPNKILSPILASFESKLESARSLASSDQMLAAVKSAYLTTIQELFDFNQWAKSVGPSTDFDAAKYEEQAVKKAQKYWEPMVRELRKVMG